MTTQRVWLIPLTLAAGVAAVIVTVTLLVAGGGDHRSPTSRPALLHLANAAGTVPGAAEPALGAPTRSGGSGYVLAGTLPAARPPAQLVWRVVPADSAAASRVASALGLAGSPTRVHGGWVLRAPVNDRLLVREDGSWSFGLDCFGKQPIAEESTDVLCAAAASGGMAVAGVPAKASGPPAKPTPSPADGPPEPVDPPQPMPVWSSGPSAASARILAGPTLAALGLADARVAVTESSPTTTVQASYDVHGATTVGDVTSLSYDGKRRLVSADGWLPRVVAGDRYPVVSARRGFELLQQQPRPMMEMCLRRPDGKPGCADIPPVVITGATLGLTLAQDDGRPTLVPAWLFRVKGRTEPLAQVAVEPSYLAPPVPPQGSSGGNTGTKPVVTPEGASPA